MAEKKQHDGPKVAIIGGGISGLATAKQLSAFNPILFEATNSIGGVWKHCSYRTTKLQTPRRDYEFSDFPWKNRDDPSFPSSNEIVEYLEDYATHFNLWRFIRLEAKVVDVKYLGDQQVAAFDEFWGNGGRPIASQPVWEIGVVTDNCQVTQWYKFDFVVMCIGKYGDIKKIPSFPKGKGPEVFKGKVMHSLDYCKLEEDETKELMKGKNCVVVGYKKSAIDLAVECAEANKGVDGKACTMVIRTLHWTVPSYSIWGLPFFLFYSTRLAQFLHESPNQGYFKSLLCHLLTPMKTFVAKFIESYLAWKSPLEKYGLKPDHPFHEDYASCQMAILPENFFEEADQGRIKFKKSTKWWFYENGVVLDDGTKLEADVVFLATGFDGKKKLKSVLPGPFNDLIEDRFGIMPLYRGTIHPLIPHMAFVGYIESVSNLHTSELRARWLSRLLEEKFKLPGVKLMLNQINRETEIMQRTTRFYRRHCISTFSINHSDEICEEMGWKPLRKNNWLSEVFCPYNNQDYKEEKVE